MLKSELIKQLQAIEKDFDIVFVTPDDWAYDCEDIAVGKVKDGKLSDDGDIDVVYIY